MGSDYNSLFSHETREDVASFAQIENYKDKVQSSLSYKQGHIEVGLTGIYDTLTDHKNSLSLVSELQPSMSLEWSQSWSDSFKTHLSAQYTKRKYTAIEGSALQFPDRELSQTSLSVGVSYLFSNNLSLGFSFQNGEHLYYQQVSEGTIALKKDRATSYEVVAEQRIITVKDLSASIRGQYSTTTDGDKSITGGRNFGGGFGVQQKINKNQSLEADIMYFDEQINTLFNTLESSQFQLGLQYKWGF
jgi:outer membrane protein assembly factor BamA